VLAGDRFGPTGGLLARGVIDRFGKPMTGTFLSSFTTRDDDPPVLVSFTPEDGAEQVDPNAVVRLSFNEPILPDVSIVVTNGLGQVVSGQVTLGLNGLIAVFTPTQPLSINQSFGITVDNVRDLANNPLPGLPLTRSFQSLDTLGPDISELRIKDAAIPLEGQTIEIEALLAVSEPGASVRMSANLSVFGETSVEPFVLPYTLPLSGTVIFRAVAIDRFGNEGPLAQLIVPVVINQPPTVQFAQVTPASGPTVTGSNSSLTSPVRMILGCKSCRFRSPTRPSCRCK
jgi:hypothetical protein